MPLWASVSSSGKQGAVILSRLSPEEVQKKYKHLFKVNDQSMGGSVSLAKRGPSQAVPDEELRIQAQEDREKGQMPKILLPMSPHPTQPCSL